MTLEAWLNSRLVTEHEASPQEIADLMEIVQTDVADARIGALSPDRRLACCYAALLTAARAALRASGYRVPKGTTSHHYRVIQSLRFTVALDSATVLRIEAMSKKRATADYVRVGEVSESMVAEAIEFAENCCERIINWIREQHPKLVTE